MKSIHLGDGVYVHFDGYHYVIAVNDHKNVVCFLDYEEAQNLINFIQENEKINRNLLKFDP